MEVHPNKEMIQELIQRSLSEDLGPGDITTDSIVQNDLVYEAELIAKEPIVVCGLEIIKEVFKELDPVVEFFHENINDGDPVLAGKVFFSIKGKAKALLSGERTALNLLQRLSGISTLTREFVQNDEKIIILDTRKTTPGLRIFEKYAVKCGGATNHRFGLFDQVLIKDNHIKISGGISKAVERVKNNSYNGPIEVETTTLEEVKEALESKVDIIMLDNMDIKTIREAVKIINKNAKIEVSGSIGLTDLSKYSGIGIDYISVGALTHSAPAVDISMNIKI